MSQYDLDEVRIAWRCWRAAVEARRATGEVQTSEQEISTLQQLERHVARLTRDELNDWIDETEAIAPIAPEAVCSCGHHREHHDGGGSCYHPVGCATVCDCSKFKGARRIASLTH